MSYIFKRPAGRKKILQPSAIAVPFAGAGQEAERRVIVSVLDNVGRII
jgi:hypothetical protein